MLLAYFENDFTENIDPKYKKIEACNYNTPHQTISSKIENENLVRYYFNRYESECKRFETGPASKDFDQRYNNFATIDLCHSYCGPSKIIF